MIEIRKIHYFYAVAVALIFLLGLMLFVRIATQVAKTDAPPPAPVKAAPAPNPAVARLVAQTQADLKKLPVEYQIVPYVQAAADLQALPRGEAVNLLKFFAVTKDSAKTKYLCLLLFDGKGTSDAAPPFARPVSLIFQEDVPFILQRFDNDGAAEKKIPDGRTFLNLCLTKATWSARHYAPVTPEQLQQAVDQLLALHIWATPLSAADKAHIYEQAGLAAGG